MVTAGFFTSDVYDLFSYQTKIFIIYFHFHSQNENSSKLNTLFLRESLSNDLNQPVFCGAGFEDASLRWLDTCDNFELFCDGIRFGMGLAFGVESRRRVAISIARAGDDVSNVSTEFSFGETSDLFDGGEVDFLRVNNSFTCCYVLNILRRREKNVPLINPLID